jgi:hypothetical protein
MFIVTQFGWLWFNYVYSPMRQVCNLFFIVRQSWTDIRIDGMMCLNVIDQLVGH